MITIHGYGAGAATILAAILVISLSGLLGAPELIRAAALRPYWLVRNREYGRLISSGFVHANLTHLLFNLLTYYFFAFALEQRIGTGSFVALYFLGLVVANLGTSYLHRDDPDYVTLGASGAILAVLFAASSIFRPPVC